MGDELAGSVDEAEELAQRGEFEAAKHQIAAVAAQLQAADRPDLLARSAWVAAISSLAESDTKSFDHLAGIAAEAAELAAGSELRAELELLARRVSTLARIGETDNADTAVMSTLGEHAELLLKISNGADHLWHLVDIDRQDWPHLFAAVRSRLGRPCRAEALMTLAPTDPIGLVVLAVVLGLGPDANLGPDELAALCFQHPGAVAEARRSIDACVADGRLTIKDGRVALAAVAR